MKQSLAEPLSKYAALIERYHETLDLMSQGGLERLSVLLEEGVSYGEMIAGLSPAPVSILDLGSGVGLPGIPVALALPGVDVALVERRRRRASFLRIAVSQLRLANATVFQADVQSLTSPCCDVVVAQAVASLAEVYRLTAHLHGESVWLLSRKGEGWKRELDEMEAQAGIAAAEWREEPLPAHGTLVAVLLPGGSACPPSG